MYKGNEGDSYREHVLGVCLCKMSVADTILRGMVLRPKSSTLQTHYKTSTS